MGKAIAAVLLCLFAAVFCGCQKSAPAVTVPQKTSPTSPAGDKISKEGQLIASCETQEAAEELADLYGIELVNYAYEIALFRTDEDPQTVIQRGIDNGWPSLELNHTVSAF